MLKYLAIKKVKKVCFTIIGFFFFLIISNGLISSVLAETRDGSDLKNKSWNEIVEIAKGGEVNWFLWGGADHINST